ncbi:MAG: trigger factor, partial [Gammaproteobacteria bacterium]|nr:trigger factor [Gammaproteobacteria bacterium]
VSFSIPADEIRAQVTDRLKALAKTTKAQGFRTGKVPMKMVEKMHGLRIQQEVLEQLSQMNFFKATMEHQLRPAGTPTIEPEEDGGDNEIKFVATFDIYPEIELADLSGKSLTTLTAEISDADIDRTIENLRQQRADWESVARAGGEGDRVTIDFSGSIGGELFEGGTAQNVPLILGSGTMIAGFEEGVVGMAPGEERTIEVTFPADYPQAELAGKEAQFAITAHIVEAPKLPAVDTSFIQQLGIEPADAETLRQKVRENLDREAANVAKNNTKQKVFDLLLETHQFLVPAALVDSEAQQLAHKAAGADHQHGEHCHHDTAPHMETATKRVRLGLLLGELIKQHELKADPDRVRTMVDEIAGQYEQRQEVIDWYYSQPEQIKQIEAAAQEDQIVDLILSQVTTTKETVDFQTLTG